MADTEVKATQKAVERAEAAGLDLAGIEGTGADGQVTTQDVDKAITAAEQEAAALARSEEEAAQAAAEVEAAELVILKLNPALVGEGVTTVEAGGRTWPSRRSVTRADFEENLRPAKDTEGRQVLHIERKVN